MAEKSIEEISNFYETIESNPAVNLEQLKKTFKPIPKNDIATKLTTKKFENEILKESYYENFSVSNDDNHKSAEIKNKFFRKPVPSPKPAVKNYSLNIQTLTDDQTSSIEEELLYSIPMKTNKPSKQGGINTKDIMKTDTHIESSTLDVDASKEPKLYAKAHNRSASLNEKDIYSKIDDYDTIEPNNYYNMFKGLHIDRRPQAMDHIYEDVDESMFKQKPLATCLSLDAYHSNQGNKNLFNFNLIRPKSVKKLDNIKQTNQKCEDIIDSVVAFSRLDILAKFLKSDFDYVQVLAKIMTYKDKLLIHKKFLNQFSRLFRIIGELKICHSNVIEKLHLKLSKNDGGIILIGDDLKEFANYDYNLNKEYLDCYKEISPSTQTYDTECLVLLYFSMEKKQFFELLALLVRPIVQLQITASFFEELSNSEDHQQAEDKQEINNALSIVKDLILSDIPNDLGFLSLTPLRTSYLVEVNKNEKKASYVVLFPDVIASLPIHSTGKKSKYLWAMPIINVVASRLEKCELDYTTRQNDLAELQCMVAKQLHAEEEQTRSKLLTAKRSESLQKKLEKMDFQILTKLSILPLTLIDTSNDTSRQLFFSSSYDRLMWHREINGRLNLKLNVPACQDYEERLRRHASSSSVKTILSDSVEYVNGNLCLTVISLVGSSTPEEVTSVGDYDVIGAETSDLYVAIELDYYGYFLHFASTKKSKYNIWNETFTFDIEGAMYLLFVVYKTEGNEPFGKAVLELCSLCSHSEDANDISLRLSNGDNLKIGINFTARKFMTRRTEAISPNAIFGSRLSEITDTNPDGVPTFVVICVKEIEARGLEEQGLYRISGISKKTQKIRSHFDSNQHEQGIALIRSEDINGVASLLKLFFHTLPESLFSDSYYQLFVDGVTKLDRNQRPEYFQMQFNKLPRQNRSTAIFIINHLVKVAEHQDVNLMTLQNLATIWGPTLLRPALRPNLSTEDSANKLASEATDMSVQTNILLFFLNEAKNNKNIFI